MSHTNPDDPIYDDQIYRLLSYYRLPCGCGSVCEGCAKELLERWRRWFADSIIAEFVARTCGLTVVRTGQTATEKFHSEIGLYGPNKESYDLESDDEEKDE